MSKKQQWSKNKEIIALNNVLKMMALLDEIMDRDKNHIHIKKGNMRISRRCGEISFIQYHHTRARVSRHFELKSETDDYSAEP